MSIAVAVQNQQELGLNEVALGRQKLYEHWHLNCIYILCWLNALVITSEHQKCVSVMFRKRNQSTTKSKPRFEVSASLSPCLLPSPMGNLSVLGIWLCACLWRLGNLSVSVSVCLSLISRYICSVFTEQHWKHHIEEGMKNSLQKSCSFTRFTKSYSFTLLSPTESDNKSTSHRLINLYPHWFQHLWWRFVF